MHPLYSSNIKLMKIISAYCFHFIEWWEMRREITFYRFNGVTLFENAHQLLQPATLTCIYVYECVNVRASIGVQTCMRKRNVLRASCFAFGWDLLPRYDIKNCKLIFKLTIKMSISTLIWFFFILHLHLKLPFILILLLWLFIYVSLV